MTTIGNVSSVSTVPRALRDLAHQVNDLSGADPHGHHVSEYDVRNALARQASAKLRGKRPPLPGLDRELHLLRRYLRRPGRGVPGGQAPSRGREFAATLANIPLTDRPIDVVVLDAKGKKVLWHGSPDSHGKLRIRADKRSGKTVRVIVQMNGVDLFNELSVLGPSMTVAADWSAAREHYLSTLGQDWALPATTALGDVVALTESVTGLDRGAAQAVLEESGALERPEEAWTALRFLEANASRLPLAVRQAYLAPALEAWLSEGQPRARYRALLVALQYNHPPVNPSTEELFVRWPRKEVDVVGGGFGFDLELTTDFGTFRNPVSDSEVEQFLRAHRDRIRAGTNSRTSEARKSLVNALRKAARDPHVLAATKHYFETGGTLFATAGGGRYDPGTPNKMSVGSLESARDTELTLVHEMLHYVFDRADYALGEVRDNGGGDHPVIHALVSRYALHSALGRGENPLDKQFGVGTADLEPDSHQALRAAGQAIADNNVAGLRGLLTKDLSEELATRWSILPTEWKLTREDTHPYTPSQEAALTELYRPSARILVRALDLAATLSEQSGTPLAQVFQSSTYRQQIKAILADAPLRDGAQKHT